MEEEKKKKKNGLSLRSRIFLIVLSCFIPLTALIGYLLYTQYTTVQAFDRVANSVNYASKYVKEFKERMDYSMYYATVWDKPVSELREGIYSVGGVDCYPYDYRRDARGLHRDVGYCHSKQQPISSGQDCQYAQFSGENHRRDRGEHG